MDVWVVDMIEGRDRDQDCHCMAPLGMLNRLAATWP